MERKASLCCSEGSFQGFFGPFRRPQRTKYLLTTGALYALVAYFDITDFQFAVALLGNWENLLRTQSEGLMMFVGEPQDQTVRPARPNGVHVDKKGQANLWLKKRKHRPAGSRRAVPELHAGAVPNGSVHRPGHGLVVHVAVTVTFAIPGQY